MVQCWRGRWGVGVSAAPRGTCFPCALVHLPVFSNGAQQGGMNRPESGSAPAKLHRGVSACAGPRLVKSGKIPPLSFPPSKPRSHL